MPPLGSGWFSGLWCGSALQGGSDARVPGSVEVGDGDGHGTIFVGEPMEEEHSALLFGFSC